MVWNLYKLKTCLLVIFLLSCYFPLSPVSTSAQVGGKGTSEFRMNKNMYNYTISFEKNLIQKGGYIEFDLSVKNTSSSIDFSYTASLPIVTISTQNNTQVNGDTVNGVLTSGNIEKIFLKLIDCINDKTLDISIVFTKTTITSPLVDIGMNEISQGKDNCISSIKILGLPLTTIILLSIIPLLGLILLILREIKRGKQTNELYPKDQ